MNLQELVTHTIETMGGVVMPLEYALCQALLPDEYAARFQGQTELKLAFDFEVAEENPDAEFVTFGSSILEELLGILKTTPKSTTRYVEVERLSIFNPEEKIKKLIDEKCGVSLMSQTNVIGLWGLFVFQLDFISDENFEEICEVWVNLLTGEIDDKMVTTNIFYGVKPVYLYPYSKTVDFPAAFEKAYNHVTAAAGKRSQAVINMVKINEELARVDNYYLELLRENEKRAKRKGISQERIEEYQTKAVALEIEKDRQKQEIKDNMIPKVKVTLLQGITYHIPLIELSCRIHKRLETEDRMFYYEPIYKRIVS